MKREKTLYAGKNRNRAPATKNLIQMKQIYVDGENGDAGTDSDVICDSGSSGSFSKHDAVEGCRLCLQPVGNIFFQLFVIVEVFTGKERLEIGVKSQHLGGQFTGQNKKLGGHQTCLSINRLWHELWDMLRHLVGTTAPGHHDCSIQE
ncbi:hypothetical protein TNCV_4651001 [Trichonephila clavipes]|nr:hypothetical protein TNCV_4651001 [Trichonephila clavipes]